MDEDIFHFDEQSESFNASFPTDNLIASFDNAFSGSVEEEPEPDEQQHRSEIPQDGGEVAGRVVGHLALELPCVPGLVDLLFECFDRSDFRAHLGFHAPLRLILFTKECPCQRVVEHGLGRFLIIYDNGLDSSTGDHAVELCL